MVECVLSLSHRSSNQSTATRTQRAQTLLCELQLLFMSICHYPPFFPLHLFLSLLAEIASLHELVMREGDLIRSGARGHDLTGIQSSTRRLVENVHKLKSHCNVNVVHDSVRDLARSLEPQYELPEASVVSEHSPLREMTFVTPGHCRWCCVGIWKSSLCQ